MEASKASRGATEEASARSGKQRRTSVGGLAFGSRLESSAKTAAEARRRAGAKATRQARTGPNDRPPLASVTNAPPRRPARVSLAPEKKVSTLTVPGHASSASEIHRLESRLQELEQKISSSTTIPPPSPPPRQSSPEATADAHSGEIPPAPDASPRLPRVDEDAQGTVQDLMGWVADAHRNADLLIEEATMLVKAIEEG
mmetsp:Transcript_15412/g.45638  ORF Transcript_15412/g.45638 Transcript_15412/m.45638 type:complete len:200 (-) Transcript_15412:243-842(-)